MLKNERKTHTEAASVNEWSEESGGETEMWLKDEGENEEEKE